LAPPPFVEGVDWDGWSDICFVGLSNVPLSVGFLLGFGGVPGVLVFTFYYGIKIKT